MMLLKEELFLLMLLHIKKKNSGKRIVISNEIKDNINQENIPNTIEVFKNEEETHDKINNEQLDSSITFKKEKKKKINKEIIFPLSYSQYFNKSISCIFLIKLKISI